MPILASAALLIVLRLLSERAWRTAVGTLLIAAAAISVLGIAQVAVFHFPRAQGPFASPNFLGYYSVAHVFLALAFRWRPVAVLCALAVILSLSRGSILALAAGLAVLGCGRASPNRHPRALAAG